MIEITMVKRDLTWLEHSSAESSDKNSEESSLRCRSIFRKTLTIREEILLKDSQSLITTSRLMPFLEDSKLPFLLEIGERIKIKKCSRLVSHRLLIV